MIRRSDKGAAILAACLFALGITSCTVPEQRASTCPEYRGDGYGEDWYHSCANPVTGEGAGVPIYGDDC